ncbi:hypothetical protein ZP9_00006 [Shewanella phage ZP9]|nr:hypothetical protein ZP9_00006 [Shewanella phage ZP9]
MSGLVEVEGKQVQVIDNSPMALISAAVSSGADVEKLEKLMDLQERWEKGQARKSFFIALSKFQSMCPTITKAKQGHNSKYAPLEDIISQVKHILADCGLAYRFEQSQADNGIIKVACIISHFDGHEERTVMSSDADKSGNKQAIQAIASAVTYLRRYTFTGALGIATADEDMDGRVNPQSNELVSPEQYDKLYSLMCDANGFYTEKGAKVAKAFKIENIANVKAKDFDKIMAVATK